jgi:hypothetical protein
MFLVNQQNIESAVTTVTGNMREDSFVHRRYIAATFRIPARMALLFDGKIRSEIEILSYETGLSAQFLEEFQRAAQNLNIQSAKSLPIVRMLSAKLTEIVWYGRTRHQLGLMQNSGGLIGEVVRLVNAGDVQAAVEMILKTMRGESPDARRYIAQTLEIPESTVLIYDELQRLRNGTTGSSN